VGVQVDEGAIGGWPVDLEPLHFDEGLEEVEGLVNGVPATVWGIGGGEVPEGGLGPSFENSISTVEPSPVPEGWSQRGATGKDEKAQGIVVFNEKSRASAWQIGELTNNLHV
jgi:hypothetical protein